MCAELHALEIRPLCGNSTRAEPALTSHRPQAEIFHAILRKSRRVIFLQSIHRGKHLIVVGAHSQPTGNAGAGNFCIIVAGARECDLRRAIARDGNKFIAGKGQLASRIEVDRQAAVCALCHSIAESLLLNGVIIGRIQISYCCPLNRCKIICIVGVVAIKGTVFAAACS